MAKSLTEPIPAPIVPDGFKEILPHVLWIGGPANSGKTTIAKRIAKMKGYLHYSYDKTGRDHLQKLAQTNTKHQNYIQSVLDDRWAGYTPEEIAKHSLAIARERFQFVLEDIKELSNNIPVVAEGAGFTPELIQPVLASEHQGIWLVATKELMEESFRKKAGFLKPKLGNQAEEIINVLFQANIQLMEIIQSQAKQYGYKLYEIDRTRSVDENAANVWAHFSRYTNGA